MKPAKFKVSSFDPKTLLWWRSRRDKIDMDPPYQRRGRLWSETDKAYLIDSILNGFDVPKLYIADFTWGNSPLNKKRLPYAIIDGKQRFEAIYDFFDGRIALNGDFVLLQDPSLQLGGLSYQDLKSSHSAIAEDFENYPLSVMSVVTDNEELINDLFVRLNRSKPLTGAEIRNAMNGPAPDVIRRLAGHELFAVNSRFEGVRGQYLNAAAKILAFEFAGRLVDTKKRPLDEFVRNTREQRPKLELSGRRVVDVLDTMTEIFLPKDLLLSSAGILPVYYWLVRAVSTRDHPRLREFLVRFEDERKENRRLVSDSPTSRRVDRELIEYDNYNRSTNDQQSHEGRFAILLRRFRIWPHRT